jgi:CheY-like chemotaxis protein
MPLPHAPHVVVLDRSPLYAEVYGNVFAAEGYRVSALTDCAIAPADLLAMLPDLVVLDLRCGGGLAGLVFLRRLRAAPSGRAVPVVASTPSSLLDMGRFGEELRTLGAAIFDGFAHYDEMLAAARAATAQAHAGRRQAGAARDRLRAAQTKQPPT